MGIGSTLGGIIGTAVGGPIGGAIGSTLGGAVDSKRAGDAVSDAGAAQLAATREGIAAQERALEQLRADLAPFTGLGVGAIPMLQSALGLPQAQPVRSAIPAPTAGSVTQLPRELAARTPTGGSNFEQINEIDQQIADLEQAGGVGVAGRARNRAQILRLQAQKEQILGGDVVVPSQAQDLQQPIAGDFIPAGEPAEFQAPTNEFQFSSPVAFDETLLQNPLLRALQDDVTDRLTARRAAAGKLASGGTARALQDALVPQAIQFGLQQEDLRQRGIDNLFRTVGLGQSSAAQTGAGALTTGANIGQLTPGLASAGTTQVLGREVGRQGIGQSIESLISNPAVQNFAGGLFGGGSGFQSTASLPIEAGAFLA